MHSFDVYNTVTLDHVICLRGCLTSLLSMIWLN